MSVLILSVFLFSLSLFDAVTSISSCQTLSSNTEYGLTGNVTASNNSRCFTGSGVNVTLNCGGNTIFGNLTSATNLQAIYITGNNLKIINCNFDNWNTSSSGSTFYTGNNSLWENITLYSRAGVLNIYSPATNTTLRNVVVKNGSRIQIYGTSMNTFMENISVYGALSTTSTTFNNTVSNSLLSGSISLDGSYCLIYNSNITSLTGNCSLCNV
jgi:hypothetical protein